MSNEQVLNVEQARRMISRPGAKKEEILYAIETVNSLLPGAREVIEHGCRMILDSGWSLTALDYSLISCFSRDSELRRRIYLESRKIVST